MKILKFDCSGGNSTENDEIFKTAAEDIAMGRLIVYPTDTVYGIGADAYNEVAIKNLYVAKNRPFDMPLTIAVSDMKMMEEVAVLDEIAEKLVKKFLPGPLTILLEKKPSLPDMVTAGSKLIGVRIPDHPVSYGLPKLTGPITSTSANVHSHPDAINIEMAVNDLGDSINTYICSGSSNYKKSSTIVWISKGEIKIVRQGVIPAEQIEAVINA
ncbi:MAG: threonylcarbamoyl-AMP synthase [Candidatus Methanoplasma sp.]|jgi:L-threonylcarbamoyladenylate synthase|nr:threonylcarbamoyl-AMP synthase [Candidatus Methanoplasma sp.]